MGAADDWLKRHGVDCRRFNARVSPQMCARYREDNPEKCQGCAGHDAQPAPKVQRSRPVGAITVAAPRNKKPKEEDVATKKVCADCGREIKIIGRGLCGSCYHRNKREGTLDKFRAKAAPARSVAEMRTEPIEAESSEIQQRPEPSAPKEKRTDNSIGKITVAFMAEDRELYEEIVEAARFNRRPNVSEVLFRLDREREARRTG